MFVFDRSVANGHNRLVDFPNGIQPHAFESPIRHPSDLCLSRITPALTERTICVEVVKMESDTMGAKRASYDLPTPTLRTLRFNALLSRNRPSSTGCKRIESTRSEYIVNAVVMRRSSLETALQGLHLSAQPSCCRFPFHFRQFCRPSKSV